MAQISADEISKLIREQIENYEGVVEVAEVGSIISLGDGIARLHGLEKVMAGEMLEFPHDVAGIAMNLEEDQVGAVLLGEYSELKEGWIRWAARSTARGPFRRPSFFPWSASPQASLTARA
jgi:F-type H+-transporting ATPase subunit alpha